MEMNIRCEKCGHMNIAEPESQCENCGEHLYQFYLKTARSNKYKKVMIIASITISLAIIIFILTQLTNIRMVFSDPVKKDLINYLKQISIQRNNVYDSTASKQYSRYILGSLDEADTRVILSKMKLKEIPSYDDADKYEKYWKEYSIKSEKLQKSKTIKEKYKIIKDNYQSEAYYYSRITPITNEIESVHKYLIRSKELGVKSYDSFVSGLDLGYISNVRETNDGSIKWSFNINSRKYGDDFKNYKETSDDELKSYFRLLEQLVERYNLLTEYKVAYPLQGYQKEKALKKAADEK
jgi:hypothetical protein